MSYKYSRLDTKNREWFATDNSRQTLTKIAVREGSIRSLKPCEVEFRYPFSAIAGKNGSGKSTLLAIAACAFHSSKSHLPGFPGRKHDYYTFSDFLVQSAEEVAPEGITIDYSIRHNAWREAPHLPNGVGLGVQARQKKKGGKWTEYSRRVLREVMFFGINRVVPHSERSVAVGHRATFRTIERGGWEDEVKKAVGTILGVSYEDFQLKRALKHRLPVVRRRTGTYSGFNMGAGENALFELLSYLYACPGSPLVLIDELELGLHEQAQKRLVEHLKQLCFDRKMQIICTTHSPTVIGALPPEARLYVESGDSQTAVTPAVSPLFAAGKLGGVNGLELDIFVEDEVAAALIGAALPTSARKRVTILPIGSASAVIRQMAARYKERRTTNVLAILDGDQASRRASHSKVFGNALETSPDIDAAKEWLSQHVHFLPGENWPERWIVEQLLTDAGLATICAELDTDIDGTRSELEAALNAPKHAELFHLAESFALDEDSCRDACARMAARTSHCALAVTMSGVFSHLGHSTLAATVPSTVDV
ncbi:AAA family ATPase [Paraburkholderia sediminicola]|uniref:ATP-dependent nuclease n=1 Tax=Paraburkholderia sediminicola TaxID=458836 RepID=UPI0038B727A7